MRFTQLAETLERLEGISSGNEMRKVLAKLFKKTPKSEIKSVAYLLTGRIAPDIEGRETGVAAKMAVRALAKASGLEAKKIQAEFKRKGDLGLVAEQAVKGRKGESLSPNKLVKRLNEIAKASGTGSQERKLELLSNLLRCCTPQAAKYVTRIVLGHLRVGFNVYSVLDALSLAFTGSKKSRHQLEEALNKTNDLGLVAETFARQGAKGVKGLKGGVGAPIRMMLAQRVKSLAEIKKRIPGKITAEEKYDGERFQAHKEEKEMVIFSRRLENITKQYPDVKERLKKNVKGKSFIVEGEIVPVDGRGRILEFQKLMQRRRKYKVEEYIKKIPVEAFLFDVLNFEGKDLTKKAYPERRKQLEKMVKEKKGKIELARQINTTDLKAVDKFFHKALDRGTEGLVCKSNAPDSVYRAGARAWTWIKWKREYVKGLMDTFDLVVVGALAGRGVRAGTYGSLLCAAFNQKKNLFETVCKLGTGFSEKELKELPRRLGKFRSKEKPKNVDSKIKPDAWFKPGFVIEVAAGEITKSPIHTAGEGLALRFPRLLRYREDKSARQATTVKEIKQMYGRKKGK
jgi:DNA ligase-1